MNKSMERLMTDLAVEAFDASGEDTRNRGFIGAWKKGWIAGVRGDPRKAPYYTGTATVGGGREVVTWGRAFAGYWLDGYDAGKIAGKQVAEVHEMLHSGPGEAAGGPKREK